MSIDNKQFKNTQAVLFDLDGTLVNTLPGLTQLVNQMRQDFDKRPLSEEQVSRYIGKGMFNLVHRSMTDSMDGKLSDENFDMAVMSMAKHVQAGRYDKGVLFPGVREALQKLKDAGYKLAIVTNKPYGMSLETLKTCGIEDLFDALIGGDSAEKPKPSKEPVIMACNQLQVQPDNAVMVGDSGNDSASALAAGVHSLLVGTGWNEGVPLSEIAQRDKAVAILKGIPEVADFLLQAKCS